MYLISRRPFFKVKRPGGSDRVQHSDFLDYGNYDTGDDHNLVFYDKPAAGAAAGAGGKLPRAVLKGAKQKLLRRYLYKCKTIIFTLCMYIGKKTRLTFLSQSKRIIGFVDRPRDLVFQNKFAPRGGILFLVVGMFTRVFYRPAQKNICTLLFRRTEG
jgi:hypothetical protein